MFDKTIGQFLQGQAHVFEAHFLADDKKWNRREAAMHRAHQVTQYGTVTDSGIEQAQGRR